MTVNLYELATQVRHRADVYGSSHINSDGYDLYPLINEAIRHQWDMMIEAFGDEFFCDVGKLTVSAGISNYSTSTVVAKWGGNITGVPWKIIRMGLTLNNVSYPIQRFNSATDPFDFVTEQTWTRDNVRYWVRWNYITFYPCPDAEYVVDVFSIPTLTDLSAVTDTLDTRLEPFKEYLITYAAIKVLDKQERDSTALRATLADIREHIIRKAPRKVRQPRTVADVERLKANRSSRYGLEVT